MAEYYLIPKRLARRLPKLGALAQRVEGALFRLVFRTLRAMSLESAYRIAGPLFGLLGPLSDKADKARKNLAVAFPESDERWRRDTTRSIFRHLGYAAVELVKLDQIWDQRERRLEFVLQPRAAEVIAAKRPIVFVCAHVGPWQAVNLIAREYGLDVGVVYAPESHPAMGEIMAELRGRFGVDWIASTDGVRPLLRKLESGNCIGLAMGTRLGSGKPLPFFGREALTNTSAAAMALRAGAALVPVNAERLPGGRFRITTYDPLECADPDGDPKQQVLELTTRVNACFEDWIRAAPGQWICLKRRWPKAHKL